MMPIRWEGNHRSGVALAMRQTSAAYPPTGSTAYGMKISTPPIHRSAEYGTALPLPFTCSRRELLGISGTDFLCLSCHPTNSVKALRETRRTDSTPAAWSHRFFIHQWTLDRRGITHFTPTLSCPYENFTCQQHFIVTSHARSLPIFVHVAYYYYYCYYYYYYYR